MQNPDLVPLIAESLDHRSLARLLATSKHNARLLTPLFAAKARPHILDHMAQQLIDTRMQVQSDVYSTRTKEDGGRTIRFTAAHRRHQFGPMTIFAISILPNVDSILISNRIGYITTYHDAANTSLSFIVDAITVCITPSRDRPLETGAVVIDNGAVRTGYANGFNPAHILEWCPVDMPLVTAPTNVIVRC
jgi:hypothetical protein